MPPAIFDVHDLTSPLAYKAGQTALLLLDFHQAFIDICPKGAAAAAQAAKLREWALAEGIPVFHCWIDVDIPPQLPLKGGEMLKGRLEAWRQDRKLMAPPEALTPKQENGPDEYIVYKTVQHVSALKSKDFTTTLAKKGIKSLIVTGVATSGAVMRTVAAGTDDGYVITVPKDACADRMDNIHDTLVNDVFWVRAHVATTDELIAAWPKAS